MKSIAAPSVSPDDVRKYLTGRGADGDAFEAVDDGEKEWLMIV